MYTKAVNWLIVILKVCGMLGVFFSCDCYYQSFLAIIGDFSLLIFGCLFWPV